MLRLHTFGGCFLTRDGTRLDAVSGQRKALALLAVLAAAGDAGAARDVVLAYLWPESDQERARVSLNQLVHSLRQRLGEPELLLTTGELRFNRACVTSDVAEFRDALRREDPATAVSLYAGPFLDGVYLRGADEFERWAAGERSALAQSWASALETLAERADARGDWRAAVEWWRRLSNAEPLSARAATGLMRALAAGGEVAAALQHARVYQLLVDEMVGAVPDPSVAALVAQLQSAAAPSPPSGPTLRVGPEPAAGEAFATNEATSPASPAGRARPHGRLPLVVGAGLLLLVGVGAFVLAERREPAARARMSIPRAAVGGVAPRPSVAVLPFANTSGDPGDEHFSDGLTDEVIGALGRVTGLKVSGRTSVFALKGRRLGVRAIADTLHVATVVEGSVRRAGGRLKVTAQLVDAATDSVLWASSFDRAPADVFAVQEEIARAIVGALRVRLRAGGGPRVHRATADLAAYDLYLKGRYFLNRVTVDDIRRAMGYFEQAVALDPRYAAAHAGLADAHLLAAIFTNASPAAELARAKAAAARALALDSTLAEAHTTLASVLMAFDWNWTAAGREFERAIALDPGYALAHQRYGLFLMYQGRLAEAQTVLEQARAVDPLYASVNMNLGRVHVSAHRPEAAIPLLRTAVELSPGLALAHEQLGHAYLEAGRADDALAAFRRAAMLSGPRDSAQLAYALAVTGRRADAERVLRGLLASSGRRYLPPVGVAMAYVGLGDHDAAFEWLHRAHARHAAFMDGIKATPAFDPLHADARWERLLRRMGLTP